MINENAMAKTDTNAMPTIKRIRKRTKQRMIAMSAVLVLASVFILINLICVGWYNCNIKVFVCSVNSFYL